MAENEVLLKHVESAMLETVRRSVDGISTLDAAKAISYTPSGANYVLNKLADRGLIQKTKTGNKEVIWMSVNGTEVPAVNYDPLPLQPKTKPAITVQEVSKPPLVGREQILEELIATEIRLRQLDDEFMRKREELALKSRNLKAQILTRVVAPREAPKVKTKKSTRQKQTVLAAEVMAQYGQPVTISEMANLMNVEHAVARGCTAELVRKHIIERQLDGKYVLTVHADQSAHAVPVESVVG